MANNFDENAMNNIKNLVDNGNISEAISQISPEMIENFSKIMNSGNAGNTESSENYESNGNDGNSSTSGTSNHSNNSNFDFSKLDMNTILKLKSVMEKMNDKNDPRYNLLYSLKPYLRHTRQDKLDQYVNLLNFTKVADILKNDKKDGKNV